jgi:integrase
MCRVPDIRRAISVARRASGKRRNQITRGKVVRRLWTVGSRKLASGETLWRLLCIHYHEGGGQSQTSQNVGCGPDHEAEARSKAARLQLVEEAEAANGSGFLAWHAWGQPLPIDRLIRQFAAIKKKTVSASTHRRYVQYAERIAERFGASDAAQLTEEAIGDYVLDEYNDNRAPDPTINAAILLRGAIKKATSTTDSAGRSHLQIDPLPELTKVAKRAVRAAWETDLAEDEDGEDVRVWSDDEVAALLSEAKRLDTRVYDVCLFQYSTGARIGETLALAWKHVDLRAGTARIVRKIHRGQLGAVKTKGSKRKVDLPPDSVALLRDLRKRRPKGRWVFPSPSDSRKPWHDLSYQKAWSRVRNKASVAQFGTHSWRHTHISMALRAGKDPAWISKRCGTSLEMIFRRYAHFVPNKHREDFAFLNLS